MGPLLVAEATNVVTVFFKFGKAETVLGKCREQDLEIGQRLLLAELPAWARRFEVVCQQSPKQPQIPRFKCVGSSSCDIDVTHFSLPP